MSSINFPQTKPESVSMSGERLDRIVPAMMTFVDQNQLPGLITAIARKGKIVHFEAIEQRSNNVSAKLLPDTIFRMYSQTKPIAGVAAMLLLEEGLFSLDDPIAEYLPEFKEMKVYTESGDGSSKLVDATYITIRHLLTHTSGITGPNLGLEDDYWNNPVSQMYLDAGLIGSLGRLSGLTSKEYVKRISSLPLIAQPGTTWHYGESISVLGRLLEVVSGQSYDDFLRLRLFEPLGMTDTGYYVPPHKIKRLAPLYQEQPDGSIAQADLSACGGNYGKQPSYTLASGGLVSTASDYMRFSQMLANGGELDGVRLLSPNTVNLIMCNHLGTDFGDTPLQHQKGVGFGLAGSVIVDAIAAGSLGSEGEYGWGGSAGTWFWVDRKQEVIGLVLTQVMSSTSNYRKIFHQLVYQAITND